jgi:hypothetical protein
MRAPPSACGTPGDKNSSPFPGSRVGHHCPFCHTEMHAGVIIDRVSGVNTRPTWIPEPASESWFGGLREPVGPEMQVGTYRCPTCGYLASYANTRPT